MTADVLVPVTFVGMLALLFLYLDARQGSGHYELWGWELRQTWRVHINNGAPVTLIQNFSTNNRMAVKYVYGLKTKGAWTSACFLSWRWELYHHGHVVKLGRVHIRAMQPKGVSR